VRSNPADEWEVAEHLTHRRLVDDVTFLAVQGMRAGRQTKDDETRQYALVGLVVCGVCGRRMDAHWVHDRPGYRCRHGYSSALPRPADAPRNLYLREDHLLEALAGLLADLPNTGSSLIARRQLDVVNRIRQQRLQIVGSWLGHKLRPEVPRRTAAPPSPQDQTALDMDWTSSGSTTHRNQRPTVAHEQTQSAIIKHGHTALQAGNPTA
jgi:hypothetical protein